MTEEKLMGLAKNDPNYQACLEEVRRWEPVYLALRDALPQMQKKVMEDYISACEELDHALLLLAIKIRRGHPSRGARLIAGDYMVKAVTAVRIAIL